MIKLLPLLYTGGAVASASVVGYVVAEQNGYFDPNPQVAALTQPEAVKEPEIQVEEPEVKAEEPVAEVEPIKPEVKLPEFTTLRVEPDGSAVIAGTGPEDADIEIWDGETLIAETRSASNGDFAIVLDTPLSPGPHYLVIVAKPKEGDPLQSAEAGLINIPEPETEEEVTVLVAEPGEATEVLQKPEPVAEPKPEPVEVASLKEPELETDATEEVVETVVEEPEPVVEPVPDPATVLIEAADVEGDKIFIAGKAKTGNTVNIYLNEALLGSTLSRDNDAFLFEGTHKLSAGNHDVRADMIDRITGKVIARAEVNLLHEPEEPVIAAAPEPEAPKPDEPEVEAQEVASVEEEVAEEQKTEEVAKPVVKTGASVIIRRGDSLWRVASRNYGAGIRYTTIFEANRDQIRDPDLIYPGQVLNVPGETNQGTTDN